MTTDRVVRLVDSSIAARRLLVGGKYNGMVVKASLRQITIDLCSSGVLPGIEIG